MKQLSFFAAMIFTLSLVGCCCGRNVMMDPCDPCGGYIDQGCGCSGGCGWGFPRFWRGRSCVSCNSCAAYGGYGDCSMDGGCSGSCGGGTCGMPTSSGCGCGQTSTFSDSTYNSNYATPSSVPTPDSSNGGTSVPQLRSAPVPPVNSSPNPPPMPGADSGAYFRGGSNTQAQTVSYEEFQRLPGTIISGPGAVAPSNTSASMATSAASPAPSSQIQQMSATSQPFLAPPPPAPATPKLAPPIQNTNYNWVPASPN